MMREILQSILPLTPYQVRWNIWGQWGFLPTYFFQILHLFPALLASWFLEKTVLRENRVSGTVLMIQLMQNSTSCAYIGQNLRKKKPR